MKSASDPNGRLLIESNVQLTRYRFGHKTADFLLCPVCGADLAEGSCGCDSTVTDPRWAALESLKGQLPEEA